jgi:folate-binding protein YgfZ
LVGSKAFEIFRIESGLPLMRRDMDETNLPQEARLDAALSFQKGCYLGQEVMARIDAQGHVNRRLMALVAERDIQAGDKVFKAEREIGKVTSATRSLLMGRPVAMGYVRREFATPGEQVEIGNDHTTAIVRDFPL